MTRPVGSTWSEWSTGSGSASRELADAMPSSLDVSESMISTVSNSVERQLVPPLVRRASSPEDAAALFSSSDIV